MFGINPVLNVPDVILDAARFGINDVRNAAPLNNPPSNGMLVTPDSDGEPLPRLVGLPRIDSMSVKIAPKPVVPLNPPVVPENRPIN